MKHLIGLFLLLLASPALAQGWGDGPGQQTITYATGATLNVRGDGSDSQGGVPPAVSIEPADIASNFTVGDWITTGSGARTAYGSGNGERKIRFLCDPVDILNRADPINRVDPIVAPGNATGPHKHVFWGNGSVDQNSTFSSLRQSGIGTCAGGPLNRTAYWQPLFRKRLASGALAHIYPNSFLIYYVNGTTLAESEKTQRLFKGVAYIGGLNPGSFRRTTYPAAQQAAIDAANAATPGPTRYTISSNNNYSAVHGFLGWYCVDVNNGFHPYIKGPAGQDMLNNCPASSAIGGQIVAPQCWDGRNLTSPDGRSHIIYPVFDTVENAPVCPNGWFLLPRFEMQFFIPHNGSADYLSWEGLSSDRMNSASTPGDPTSDDPCRQTGPYFCSGATMHFDWFGAWDYATMKTWMKECLNIKLRFSGSSETGDGGGDCGTNNISDTQTLKVDVPPTAGLSNNPIVSNVDRGTLPLTRQYGGVDLTEEIDAVIGHNH